MLNTPVLFIIFNRPEITNKTFEAIRAIQPKQLYIAADGPRVHIDHEQIQCEKTRKIIDLIDWDCQVSTQFQETNLGCKVGVSSAIDWFFKHVESGIILEDDCLPDPSFFTYCEELLALYKDDERIMMISGDNFQNGISRGDASYYFSKDSPIWGWATWRRAWAKYDITMSNYGKFCEQNLLKKLYDSPEERYFWNSNFELVTSGSLDTWDYQWMYCVRINRGLTAVPNKNLISNIGFGDDATHTFNAADPLSKIATGRLENITHPLFIYADKEADRYAFQNYIARPASKLRRRIKHKFRRLFHEHAKRF